ncbi:hypothetical protein ACUV84_021583 [Puccinellia chinampoensis]
MAMERFLAALVFREAPPLDAYGTSAADTVSKQLLSGANPSTVTKPAADVEKNGWCCSGGESTGQRRRAGFDGLSFFDTVMMH